MPRKNLFLLIRKSTCLEGLFFPFYVIILYDCTEKNMQTTDEGINTDELAS